MLTKEQRQLVDKLVEESKNDRTIIVGSDIRSLSNIIEQQEKRINELEATLAKVPRHIPAFFHADQNIGEDVGQDGECD